MGTLNLPFLWGRVYICVMFNFIEASLSLTNPSINATLLDEDVTTCIHPKQGEVLWDTIQVVFFLLSVLEMSGHGGPVSVERSTRIESYFMILFTRPSEVSKTIGWTFRSESLKSIFAVHQNNRAIPFEFLRAGRRGSQNWIREPLKTGFWFTHERCRLQSTEMKMLLPVTSARKSAMLQVNIVFEGIGK